MQKKGSNPYCLSLFLFLNNAVYGLIGFLDRGSGLLATLLRNENDDWCTKRVIFLLQGMVDDPVLRYELTRLSCHKGWHCIYMFVIALLSVQ